MTCPFFYDDGVYVLGALCPAERAAFEDHLPGCAQCREAVATLAVLPGLLSRLDAERVLPQPATVPASVLPRTLAAVRARRRAMRVRSRWYAATAAVVVALLAMTVGIGARLMVDRTQATFVPSAPMSAMHSLIDHLPVTAEVSAIPVEEGTRVDMACRYDDGYEGSWPLRLMVYPRAGGFAEQLSTWTARSGTEVTVRTLTHLKREEIDRIELQQIDGERLLVWYA